MGAIPICPRCGYDLSGLVASWVNACPMHATCAECGLEFSCANVLSPRFLGPSWSYEHGLLPRAGRFWRTSWTALRPWAIWSQLSVDHAIRPRRAVRFATRWLLSMHLAALAVTAASWIIDNVSGPAGLDYWLGRVYLEPLPLLVWLLFPYNRQIAVPAAPGATIALPLLPLLLVSLVPTLLMPVWMMILGDTFAAAHVRRIHLVRGLAYAIPGALCWCLFVLLLAAAGIWATASPRLARLVPGTWLALFLAFPLYHALWWYLFIRRYLRLRHAGFTVLLFMLMTGLTLVCGVLYYQQWGRW